ncbi:MAG TPA: HoxN/HupN/NixA family nickel/cobalt transporter [Pseudonocardiaceae bacterium]|nr:HoxN/HupN/NixA family nickel/cobalt transporter [Pseudonocardiaceae bacterium]
MPKRDGPGAATALSAQVADSAVPGRAKRRITPSERRRMGGMFGIIALLHVVGFGLLFAAAGGHYSMGKTVFGIGTGVLAYTLGLRHAFDADHISAIDNTTRKLMAEKKRPLGVGFFFALGHSSVVLVLALLLNFGTDLLGNQIKDQNSALHRYTGLISTSVSGGFLLLIAGLNLIVLLSIVKVFLGMRKGKLDEAQLEHQLNSRGLLNRFFGPLARSVDTSWKMYPIGALFGVGFDTATEISLLVLAGSAAAGGLPFWAFLSLPILFTAGMTLLDTVDGTFMNFAYDWAFSRPVRKVYYNITITFLSVAVAAYIGGLEVIGLIASQLNLTGGFWDYAANFDINKAGFVIVGLFVATWVVALLVWRLGRFEKRWKVPSSHSSLPADPK